MAQDRRVNPKTFWLGRAQEVAGDHAAAWESWRKARSELEPLLKARKTYRDE